ncbi:hypothetical protein KBY71_04990 [Cyanobium sp. T1B-Tous]|nr:hypothetical protein [Cyanobium sp. T1B-Tous]
MLALFGAVGLPLLSAPARAGSVTASSIWDQSNALERAREQLPAGATVTAERCQEVEVGIGNIRYLCTVEFQPASETSPAPSPAPSP